MEAPLCLKKPAPRELFVRSQSEAQPDYIPLVLSGSDTFAAPILANTAGRLLSNISAAPPPTDLVIALQHFLI
jgi:hypothetical protein